MKKRRRTASTHRPHSCLRRLCFIDLPVFGLERIRAVNYLYHGYVLHRIVVLERDVSGDAVESRTGHVFYDRLIRFLRRAYLYSRRQRFGYRVAENHRRVVPERGE